MEARLRGSTAKGRWMMNDVKQLLLPDYPHLYLVLDNAIVIKNSEAPAIRAELTALVMRLITTEDNLHIAMGG